MPFHLILITELEIIEIIEICEVWESDFAIIELLLDKVTLFIYHMNI
jgi:hypothetical protein